MPGMKVSLPGAFKNIARHLPSYAPVLEELEKHLRETIRGKHTLQEFAEFYCLDEKPARGDGQIR